MLVQEKYLGAVHDLRNCLHIVIEMARHIRKQKLDQEAIHECLDTIIHFGERATGILKNSNPPVININDVILDLMKLIRPFIKPMIAINANLTSSHLVRISPVIIDRILINLISNASEAIEDVGAILIHTSNVPPEVSERYNLFGHCVCMTVIDTGCGIPADEKERIFYPFYTSKDGEFDNDGGGCNGIGLTTVHNLLEEIGGRIFVESKVNDGSSFSVLFPSICQA